MISQSKFTKLLKCLQHQGVHNYTRPVLFYTAKVVHSGKGNEFLDLDYLNTYHYFLCFPLEFTLRSPLFILLFIYILGIAHDTRFQLKSAEKMPITLLLDTFPNHEAHWD